MIGPHEGTELPLMLEGKKPLAAFSDIIPENGKVAEEIIPEKLFKPHVVAEKINRHEHQFQTSMGIMKIVCFTIPDENWRAKSYCFFREKIHKKEIEYTDTMDVIFGNLLGYSKVDIQGFVKQE
ncbi:MAG: hypothetical protein COB76_03140 [Alphaproteobacteria bacterium]|nr:MAG: hypothetical protein COB76_03140 [Alphaproteobacteria bacterium]